MDRKTQIELLQKLAKLAGWIMFLPDSEVASDLKEMKAEAELVVAWVDGWYEGEEANIH
jgi:hypothetical protein